MRKLLTISIAFFVGVGYAASSQDPVQQALAQLKDIHTPPPISWWPLAFGWYIFVGGGLIALILLIGLLRKLYLRGRAKRKALNLLRDCEQCYRQNNKTEQKLAAQVSELLKRVAMVYFPRNEVAGLQGEDWICFLNKTSNGMNFNNVKKQLLEQPYQANVQMDLQPLFPIVRQWIKQRRRPCSN